MRNKVVEIRRHNQYILNKVNNIKSLGLKKKRKKKQQ